MARTATAIKPKPKVKSYDVTPDAPKKKKGTSLALVSSKEIIKPTSKELVRYGHADEATVAMNALLNTEFDALDIKYEMVGGATKSLDRISSDSLVLDTVTGGGFTPTGINQMVGMEAAGKTTAILHTLGRAITTESVSLINLNDAENTMDLEYLSGILGPKFDQNLLASRLRYSDQNILESYFDYLRGVMRTLPDKIWIEEVGAFCYRLNMGIAKHKQFREAIEKAGIKPDKKLSNKDFVIIPTDSTSPQALFMLDSFPALITGKSDDRESDEGGGMSEKARVMSELLPKVAGRFRKKGVILLATNQLRDKPGVIYGSPTYEAGGNALRFYSAQRTWVTTRVAPDDTFKRDKEASQLNVEDNPLGGKDYYSFKEFRNVKNKAGTPFLRGWARIWTADPGGRGHGIDPVFDLWWYLKMTGQVQGARVGKRGFQILLPQARGMDAINWHTFKLMVLAEKFGGPYAKKLKEEGYTKLPRLLEWAWSQMGPSNVGIKLRAEQSTKQALGKVEKDESDD